MTKERTALKNLAQQYGIQIAYKDAFNQIRTADTDTLLSILKALKAPISHIHEANNALREEKIRHWKKPLPPIILATDGKLPHLTIRISKRQKKVYFHGSIILESGEIQNIEIKKTTLMHEHKIEGQNYLIFRLDLLKKLPYGYHQLFIEYENKKVKSLIISSPQKAYSQKIPAMHEWGLFSPLYALHSANSLGAGDLSDLNEVIQWIAAKGGHLFGTLPLFSAFLDEPCEPSPYSPLSKLFLNEFYLDIRQIPEFQQCQKIQKLYNSSDFQDELKKIKKNPLIDYKKIMALKRRILEPLSQYFFTEGNPERKFNFQEFFEKNPELENFSEFRAFQEKMRIPWPEWPSSLNYDLNIKNYHLYAQWQIHQQMENMALQAQKSGVKLYLDMPLSVHPYSYDTWRNQDLFALDLSVGAPPDPGFIEGQNWGLSPLIPHKLKEKNYQYFIQTLRTVLPYLNLLRIDHVMSLHRVYCIPKNNEINRGAFVRSNSEELYSILCLESQRYQASLVGENLGTVPQYVNRAMHKHGLYRMSVLQYDLDAKKNWQPEQIPARSISSLNTHDMFPFAGFVQGHDIKGPKKCIHQEWRRRRELNPKAQKSLPRTRLKKLFQKYLFKLSQSRSHFLLINLEDLWLENKPQNIPTSENRYPNWRRRTKRPFEQWREDIFLQDTLKKITKFRRQKDKH